MLSDLSFYAGKVVRFDPAVFYSAELCADAGERYGFEQSAGGRRRCWVDMRALQVNDRASCACESSAERSKAAMTPSSTNMEQCVSSALSMV
ncbi:MAG: hypothetical protein ACLT98_11615 [Eggerthellaceae bacterium]